MRGKADDEVGEEVRPTPRPRRGPPSRADTEKTRVRILDSAERLFAQHGFDGTSIRDIAMDAGIQFALVAYHYGSKLDLLDAVLGRRAGVLGADRMEHLSRARSKAGAGAIPVRTLVDGFVRCIVERASRGDEGWANYAELVAAVANTPRWSSLIDKHFNEVAIAYVRELRRSCPEVSDEVVHQAFFFAIGTFVAVCARPRRVESLSGNRFKSEDVSALCENLCVFIEGGILGLTRSAREPGRLAG